MNLKICVCVCVQGDNEVNKRPCLLPTSQVRLLSAFSCSNHLASQYSFTSKHCWRISVDPTVHPFQKPSLWILANIYLHYEPKPPLWGGCGSLSILLVSEFIPHLSSGPDFSSEPSSPVDHCTWVSPREPCSIWSCLSLVGSTCILPEPPFKFENSLKPDTD